MFEVIKPSKALVDTRKLQSDLVKAMRDTTQEGANFMRRYPMQVLTESHYKRTGTLMRSWSKEVKVNKDNIEGIISSNANMAPYNVYVQGPKDMDITIPGRSSRKGQLPLFELGGWYSVSIIARTMKNSLMARLDDIFRSLK